MYQTQVLHQFNDILRLGVGYVKYIKLICALKFNDSCGLGSMHVVSYVVYTSDGRLLTRGMLSDVG